MQKIAKREKGFTLIEVVIVIAIAAALIAIVLLAVGGAQRNRRDTTSANQAGLLGSAAEQFATNNGGNYPDSGTFASFVAKEAKNIKDPSGNPPTYGTGAAGEGELKFATEESCDQATNTLTAAAGQKRKYAIKYYSESSDKPVCRGND